ADPWHHAVHLDQVDRPVPARKQAVPGTVDDDLPGMPVEAVQLDVSRADVVTDLDTDLEPVRADPRRTGAVADATQLQAQRAAALMMHMRASAGRRRQQPLPFGAFLLLIRLDGGDDQR